MPTALSRQFTLHPLFEFAFPSLRDIGSECTEAWSKKTRAGAVSYERASPASIDKLWNIVRSGTQQMIDYASECGTTADCPKSVLFVARLTLKRMMLAVGAHQRTQKSYAVGDFAHCGINSVSCTPGTFVVIGAKGLRTSTGA